MGREWNRSGAVALAALLAAACEPTEQTCLNQSTSTMSPVCAAQVCVDSAQPILITNSLDPTTTLTCLGCEQTSPTGYTLSASGVEQTDAIPYDERRHLTIALRLSADWDQKLTAASINRALVDGQLDLYNVESGTTGGRLRISAYWIGKGDVVAVTQTGERVRLELTGHFGAAMSPQRCLWTIPQGSDPLDAPERAITIDLPYAIYAPPPPPPPPMGLSIEASQTTICRGACTTLSAEPTGGKPPFKYSWEQGVPAGAGPHTVCPVRTTSYAALATDSSPFTFGSGPQKKAALKTIVVRQDCNGPQPAPTRQTTCERLLTASEVPTQTAGAVMADVTVDAQGDMWLRGEFAGRLALGGSELGGVDRTWGVNTDTRKFLAKYDVNCQLLWSRRLNVDNDYLTIHGITPDGSGGVYLAGSAQAEHEPLSELTFAQQKKLLFTGQLSADGELLALHTRELPSDSYVTLAARDAQGNAALVISTRDGVDLGGGPLSFPTGYGMALLRLDAHGTTQHVLALAGTVSASSLAMDASGASYLRAGAAHTLQIADNPPITGSDFFSYIAKLGPDGALVYLLAPPDPAGPDIEDYSGLWALDGAGSLLIANSWVGYNDDPFPSLSAVRRVTSDGTFSWLWQTSSTGPTVSDLEALTVLSDGSFLLATSNYPRASYYDEFGRTNTPLLTRYAADGSQLGQRSFPAARLQRIASVAPHAPNQAALLLSLRSEQGAWDRLRLSRLAVP